MITLQYMYRMGEVRALLRPGTGYLRPKGYDLINATSGTVPSRTLADHMDTTSTGSPT